MSVFDELPKGVDSAMFLRDGWPHAIVCKVTMKNGCVGIGIYRHHGAVPFPPEIHDQSALLNAIQNVADEPPDYTALHEHVARMKAKAEAARPPQEEPETNEDLQAALGQKAND